MQSADSLNNFTAILQETSSTALPSDTEESNLVDQMMNDQLFHTSES